MKVFNCILGVFAILGAIYCICFPGVTFLNTGWIITVLLGAWGFCAIFDYFSNSNEAEKSKSRAGMGTLGLIAGIAAAVISVLSIFSVVPLAIIDTIMLYLFAGWFIISGVMSISGAFRVKKTTSSKSWVLTLILGILVLLAGIYGCFHPLLMARTEGLLIGIYLMTYGIRLICSPFEKY